MISINKASEIKLIEKFSHTYQLCNKDFNKLTLILRKGVYLYDYMSSWERFNEDSLPPKKCFYDELNKKDITEEDYAHAQKVWKVFKIKNLGSIMIYMFRSIQHYLWMCLKILGICAKKYISLIRHILCLLQDYHGKHA